MILGGLSDRFWILVLCGLKLEFKLEAKLGVKRSDPSWWIGKIEGVIARDFFKFRASSK
jgi:hypothetical protein